MADSSEEALWRSFVQQDKYLRKVLQRIWMASQDLNMSTEYTGVESMITIDKELPIKYRVLQQENRLEALNVLATDLDSKLATRVAGDTQGSVAGSTHVLCKLLQN